MLNTIISQGAKFVSKFSKAFNLGNGSTWPGHIALKLDENIISHLLNNSNVQTILIVGTNGKTTTGKMLTTILEGDNKKVIQNTSGANLLNGIASSLLLHTNHHGKLTADYGVFEVDENNLPLVLRHMTPTVVVALNLFRDQLDRYGELDSIAKKWNKAFHQLPVETTLVLNADDPLIAYVAKDVVAKVVYFGADERNDAASLQDEVADKRGSTAITNRKLVTPEHGADSVYCPNCGHKLDYKKVFYSHLGIWSCPSCGVKRPLPYLLSVTSPLPGLYNTYNTYAAALAAHELDIPQAIIEQGLQKVVPAFGRQEKIMVDGKHVQIFLSKNPISMNESLRTIADMKAKHALFVLNDRIPDGLDVSWIWDIDLESYEKTFSKIFVAGDRVYDFGLRIAYSKNDKFLISNFKSNPNVQMFENLKEAIEMTLNSIDKNETLYILPTYSAMLEVRKILTGRKIL